jgi:hypothetical protein
MRRDMGGVAPITVDVTRHGWSRGAAGRERERSKPLNGSDFQQPVRGPGLFWTVMACHLKLTCRFEFQA